MKKRNLVIVLALILLVLTSFSWNPLVGEGLRIEVTYQLKETFSGLFGGTGLLTPAKLISAATVVVMVWIVNIVVCWILEQLGKKNQRSLSVIGLFTSLCKFICVIVGGVWALGVLGVNIAGIFASLGIASLIIGFGAQSLIEDMISGIFIIFEGQYHVGDIIVLDEFRGYVRNIGIRTTMIEDDGGNFKICNNSDIRNLQNRSMNRSIAATNICISYNADIPTVENIILAALPEMFERNKDVWLTVPRYAGVDNLGESSVELKFLVDVNENNFFSGRRRLNRELKILLDKHNIEIPFNQIVVHKGD
ncbi:MAG: mechanosensitive ion channel family protein [Erysipelotrichaceae bacterium]|nr:mechanosensitive ion channel family protein [Erysipelotrichaceae bacterium]